VNLCTTRFTTNPQKIEPMEFEYNRGSDVE